MSPRPTPYAPRVRRRRAAILAAGQAEAEAMDKKAEAFAGYNEAAVLQMLIEVLPKVAAELARPMGNIDKLTVISTDGAGELPKQVTNNLVQTMEMLKATTGLDLESLIQKYSTTNGSTPGLAAASTTDAILTPSWAVCQPHSESVDVAGHRPRLPRLAGRRCASHVRAPRAWLTHRP